MRYLDSCTHRPNDIKYIRVISSNLIEQQGPQFFIEKTAYKEGGKAE